MRVVFRVLSYLVVLAGICLLAYPVVASVVSKQQMERSVASYSESLKNADTQQLDKAKRLAIEYDDNLVGKPLHDPFKDEAGYVLPDNYMEVLNVAGDGIMGSIEIPKIGVNLPIYHTVDETVLQKGVGHIDYTSTIYGGLNRHAWLSAHRGLPNALMFTDLNLLRKGDIFTISVLGERHFYRVFDIKVIDPKDFEQTRPQMGKDLITLVTCTPYGVNSHRLLVTGERDFEVDEKTEEKQAQAWVWTMSDTYLVILGLGVALPSIFFGIKAAKRLSRARKGD